MSEIKTYEVPAAIAAKAHINAEQYASMYQRSVDDPNGFWAEQAEKFVTWSKKFDTVMDYSFSPENLYIKWFEGGQLNVSYNCLDRHLATRGDQVAIIWEADNPAEDKKLTYREMHTQVCKLANVLKSKGVKKGDRVCIYLPMIPEAAVAMLACTRVGAVHSIVFGGFSPDSLRDRILDSDCRVLITADESVRGGRNVPLKKNADTALNECPNVGTVLVVQRTGGKVAWTEGRDVWYHEAMATADAVCEPEAMDAEDPLFILYTSGSTGKPKGALHTTGGYLVFAAMTHKYTFDYQEGEIYWCTADVGWVTGHTYIVYGPMANGATSLMFEGIPNYPDMSRFWQVVDKHQVNIFYTAPTAIRSLMRAGEEPVKATSRKSLRILGSVGEPINPEAWMWYRRVIGGDRCPIVDTWWQTETGAIMISPLPGVTATKPGSAQVALPGISVDVMDDQGVAVPDGHGGYLVLTEPWPAMLRTIWGDDQRFVDTYWARFPGQYFAGDGAKKDEDGDLWLLGRVDDVMNVSGHRISTTEVESALVSHEAVAEAAVVGASDEMTGQGIVAFVILRSHAVDDPDIVTHLRNHVAHEIGPIAKPRQILVVAELPKTRSGKIMRRLLRDVAENREIGDVTTLADSSVMDFIKTGLAGGGGSE